MDTALIIVRRGDTIRLGAGLSLTGVARGGLVGRTYLRCLGLARRRSVYAP